MTKYVPFESLETKHAYMLGKELYFEKKITRKPLYTSASFKKETKNMKDGKMIPIKMSAKSMVVLRYLEKRLKRAIQGVKMF